MIQRDKLKLTNSSHSKVCVIPAWFLKSIHYPQEAGEVEFDADVESGVLTLYLCGRPKKPLEGEIPIIPSFFPNPKLATQLIGYLKSEGPHRICDLNFLFPLKKNMNEFIAIKDFYLKRGNMFLDASQRLNWVDNPADKPKNIVYRNIPAAESKQIAEDLKKKQKELIGDVDKELAANLEAEVLEVDKTKEKRVDV